MSLRDELSQLSGLTFHPDHDLTSYTTFRLSSVGDLLEVESEEGLRSALQVLKSHQKDFLVVGWGANQILPAINEKIVIHLKFPFDQALFEAIHESYELPASVGLNYLTAHAVKFGLKGWEVFTGIPASLGGAIYMNAGTNLGEIGQLVESVRLMNSAGEIREVIVSAESFSYRRNHFVKDGDIIISAKLRHLGIDEAITEKIKTYMDFRRKSQPLATKNCGCVFKNPMKEIPAGKLIDLLGLKDFSVGSLRVSPKHGNFMENQKGATWDQFKALVEAINFQANHFYGIEFELEVKIPYD
jgi:UDP-N-acetylmuramate dehydrogenase